MSRLLIQIEMGTYNTADAVRALYDRDSIPEQPGAGHAHDHHALDRHHRPRREGAEGGVELSEASPAAYRRRHDRPG